MRFACRSQHCGQGFSSECGLSTHRLTCVHYQRHEAAALERRKELSQAIRAKRQVALERARNVLKQMQQHPAVSYLWPYVITMLTIWPLKAVKRPQDASVIAEDVQTNMSEDVQGPSQALEPIEPDVAMHPPPPPTVPALTHTGRPQRAYRLPARYEDIHPEGPAPLPSAASFPPMAPGSLALPRVILHVRDFMKTGYNRFGLMREYPHRPSYDPDTFIRHADLTNYPQSHPIHLDLPTSHEPPWPFRNMSIYRLMEWMITGSNQKSVREMDRLAKDVLGAEDFKLKDLAGFSARQENIQLDDSERDGIDTPYSCDGWVESAIEISVPCGLKDNDGLGRPFSIPGLQHRSLLAVMKAALADITARQFHFSPFRRIWKSFTGVEERCFNEAYTSDALYFRRMA